MSSAEYLEELIKYPPNRYLFGVYESTLIRGIDFKPGTYIFDNANGIFYRDDGDGVLPVPIYATLKDGRTPQKPVVSESDDIVRLEKENASLRAQIIGLQKAHAKKDSKTCKLNRKLKKLKAATDREVVSRDAVHHLWNEVDCRIAHGAYAGGHLEYVRLELRKILDNTDIEGGN